MSEASYTVEAALTNAVLAYQSTTHQVDVLNSMKTFVEELITRLEPSGIAPNMVGALRVALTSTEKAIGTGGPYRKDLEELQHALEAVNLKTGT